MARLSYLSQIVAYTSLMFNLSCGQDKNNGQQLSDDDLCLLKATNASVVEAFPHNPEDNSIDPLTFCIEYASHIEGELEECLTKAYGEQQACKILRRSDRSNVTTMEFAVACAENIDAKVSSYDNGFSYFCGL